MEALRELIALFGIKVDDKELKAADKEIDGFAEKLEHLGPKLAKIGTALAEVFGAEKLKEFVKEGIEAASHVQDLANRLDVSSHALVTFGAAVQDAGVDFDSAAAALGLFEKNIGNAVAKGGEGAAAFAKLGVHLKEAGGEARPLFEVLGDVSEGLANLPDQNQRAAAAMELFGRQGRSLLPILGQGKEALEKFLEEAEEVGNGLGDKFYSDAKRAGDAFEHFGLAVRSLKERALDAILPAVTVLGDLLKRVTVGLLDLDKETHIVSAGMAVLAAAIGVGLVHALVAAAGAAWALLAPLLATFGPPLALATALTWIIQDLWKLMTGGESVIGRLIERLAGLEAKNALVAQLRDLWKATQDAINDAAYATGYFLGVFAGIGAGLTGLDSVGEGFLFIVKVITAATRLLVGFIQAIQAIPKAISSGSFEPIGKVIQKAGDAVFEKGGIFGSDAPKLSSDVTRHGVPQAAVDLWNEHHLSSGTKALIQKQRQASTLGPGERYGAARPTANPNIVSRSILPFASPHVGGSSHAVEQHNVNHIVVHTASDQPQAVGSAVGAGVATATQKDLNAALASVVKP